MTELISAARPRRRWRYEDLAPPRLSLPFWGMVSLGLIAASVFADDWALNFHRQWWRPIVDLFQVITRLGQSDWILIPSGVILIFLNVRRKELKTLTSRVVIGQAAAILGLIFASVAFTGIVADIGKYGLGRARPTVEPGGLWSFIGPTIDPDFASFPSGHSTTMGTVAILAVVLLKGRWRLGALVLAVLVAASRVITGAHHISDTTAGFLLGLWGGWWVVWIFARLSLGLKASDGVLPRARYINLRRAAREIAALWPRRK